jgi:hypothetical protein
VEVELLAASLLKEQGREGERKKLSGSALEKLAGIGRLPPLKLYRLASLLKSSANEEAALQLFKKIIKNSGEAEFRGKAAYHVAQLYFETGEFRQAGKWAAFSTRMCPGHKKSREILEALRQNS